MIGCWNTTNDCAIVPGSSLSVSSEEKKSHRRQLSDTWNVPDTISISTNLEVQKRETSTLSKNGYTSVKGFSLVDVNSILRASHELNDFTRYDTVTQ